MVKGKRCLLPFTAVLLKKPRVACGGFANYQPKQFMFHFKLPVLILLAQVNPATYENLLEPYRLDDEKLV